MATCTWVLAPDDKTPGVTCDKHAPYLVMLPGSGFMPSCRRCMHVAITETTAHEYRIHRPGYREPVQILPADTR